VSESPKKTFTELATKFRLPRPVRIGRELAALLFWGFSFVHLFVADLFTPLVAALPEIEPVVRYRFLVLLALLAILWVALRTQRFLSFAGYIIAYPLVLALWTIPRFLLRNWATALVFSPAIYSVLRNLKLYFVLFTLALIGAAVVVLGSQAETIAGAMVLLGAYLAWHFAHRIRTAFSPSTVFADVGRGVRGVWENAKAISNLDKLQKLQPGTPEYEQAYVQNILNLYLFSTALAAIARPLKALHATRRLDLYFAASLFYTFTLTLIVFALAYLGLSKVEAGAFSGPGSFVDFLGYSFGTLTHYQLSPLSPLSGLAQFLSYAEAFSSILIGVLLAFVIFTSARERYRSDIESVVTELSTASESLETLLTVDYELTLRAAEYRLLQVNGYIARYLLRLRYGADTAKQIEDEAPKDAV
jgi:hypothetical protein